MLDLYACTSRVSVCMLQSRWFVMDLFDDTCELGGGLDLICGLVMISVDYMCDMWSSDLRFKNSPILFCQWAVLF